jgi:uncharacterized protein
MSWEPTAPDNPKAGLRLHKGDPLARAVVETIRSGDLESLERLLAENPGLAAARIEDGQGTSRTLLHVATDWPGHFPNGTAVIVVLIQAGADPNAPVEGMWHTETPLHWTASNDDVEAFDALVSGGADIEATGGSIAGGTPLDDAVGYGQWRVARRLVERGARVDKLWHAAALGMISRIAEFFAAAPEPSRTEVNDAFWQACHGGHQAAAEYLLSRGADINWIPSWAASRKPQTPLDIARGAGHDRGEESDAAGPISRRDALTHWLRQRGAKSASELT